MARHRIKLPPLGESVERVVIVEWHATVGDSVTENSVLATVETDKVDTDVPSPIAGTLVEILAGAGAELAVGEPLCVIES
jgi:pyruvate/2-oxoglutarate dehydrogenase complex dihydrolipoamide acyltransferase (E2) component